MTDLKSNVRAMADKADDIRKRTADSLESAADSVRNAGKHGAETIHELTDQAGKKLETTATIVRKACVRRAFGTDRLFSWFRNSVRRSPVQSIAIATALGLVAGFSLRSSR